MIENDTQLEITRRALQRFKVSVESYRSSPHPSDNMILQTAIIEAGESIIEHLELEIKEYMDKNKENIKWVVL